MYNLLPYLIRRSTAPHLLPPLEDDYSPDLDPNHNIEEVSPSEGGHFSLQYVTPCVFWTCSHLMQIRVFNYIWIQIMKMKPTKLPIVH